MTYFAFLQVNDLILRRFLFDAMDYDYSEGELLEPLQECLGPVEACRRLELAAKGLKETPGMV